MFDKEYLNLLSKSMGVVLYLYGGASKRLLYYNGSDEKEAAAPAWISSMVQSGVTQKLFQKDGKTTVYRCFDTGDSKYLLFQDNQDGSKLGLLVKALAAGKNTEAEGLKKELIKARAEQAKLAVEVKQKDAAIAKLASPAQADTESMRRTIKELTETNAQQLSQIRRMKADTDHTNFQKLKQINAELREEISQITFKTAEAEERSGKIRKILQNTVEELMRMLDAAKIDKNDIKNLVLKIPVKELGPSSTSQTYLAEMERPQPQPERAGRKPDITDIVNTLNSIIAKNDASGINIDKLVSVVPTADKEGIKRSPATALKSVIGTLIGMSKASRLSPLQINVLCDALGIK